MMERQRRRPPFKPGAGTQPPELVGRDTLLEEYDDGLEALEDGDYFGPRALVGPRGFGKTVLLLEMQTRAEERGWKTHRIILKRNSRVDDELLAAANSLVRELQPGRQALANLKSRLTYSSTMTVATTKLAPLSIEWSVSASEHSERLRRGEELQTLLEAIGDIARQKGSGIAIYIDEAHEATSEQLESLAVAIHELSTARAHKPVFIGAAGLPQLAARAMGAGTFGERMFVLAPMRSLHEQDVIKALREPARRLGRDYSDDALAAIYEVTEGYPYLVQLWGEMTWREAGPDSHMIDLNHVRRAEPRVNARLNESFFELRSARLSRREHEYVEAMAQLPRGERATGEIARILGRQPEAVSKFRNALIRKGVIHEAERGLVEFTVPGHDVYILRQRTHQRSRGFGL